MPFRSHRHSLLNPTSNLNASASLSGLYTDIPPSARCPALNGTCDWKRSFFHLLLASRFLHRPAIRPVNLLLTISCLGFINKALHKLMGSFVGGRRYDRAPIWLARQFCPGCLLYGKTASSSSWMDVGKGMANQDPDVVEKDSTHRHQTPQAP